MSEKNEMRFSTLLFCSRAKTSVLSLVLPPPTRTRDKTAVMFLALEKNPVKKSLTFFVLNK
jgi:hypothetical protein